MIRKIVLLLSIGAVIFGGPANAGTTPIWPMYQMGPTHNAALPGAPTAAHWIVDLEKKNNGGLAVSDGALFVGTFSQRVTAYDLETGNPIWTTPLGAIVMSTPIVANGLVFVGTGRNGRLHDEGNDYTWGKPDGDSIVALDQLTGRLVWRYDTVGEDMPSAAYVNGRLVFANGDQHAYALDARTGRLLWRIPIDGISTMASATAVGDNALLASCTVKPYACETILVDSRDGTVIWRAPYGGSDCSPTVGNNTVFVSETSDVKRPFNFGGIAIISALDLASGKLLWQYRSGVGPYTALSSSERTIAGTFDEGTYYQPLPLTDELAAFDASSGALKWKLRSTGPIKQSPVISDGLLYVGDTSGIFYKIRASDGQIVHGAAFDQPFSTSPPLLYGGTILVSAGHYLYAFPAKAAEY